MRSITAAALVFAAALTACDKSDRDTAVAAQTSVTIPVHGMHCDGCAQSLTAELGRLQGIRSCEVSFERSQALLVIDDQAAEAAARALIVSRGFSLEPLPPEQAAPENAGAPKDEGSPATAAGG